MVLRATRRRNRCNFSLCRPERRAAWQRFAMGSLESGATELSARARVHPNRRCSVQLHSRMIN